MNDDDIILEAKARFKLCQDFESDARNHYRLDSMFYWGDSYNLYQWPQEQYQLRNNQAKPCLTVNKTKVHCLQIINDARKNQPSVDIRPVGNGASFQAAEIFEGVIRHIEYISNAQEAYEAATFSQVVGGIGWWRITTDYVDENSFDQEIFIKRVPDAMSIYLDPFIQEYEGSDARFGFVFVDIPRDQFDKLYPKYANLVDTTPLGFNEEYHDWSTEKCVRVAEYYRKVTTSDRLHYMADGSTIKESDVTDPGILKEIKAISVRSRAVEIPKIEYFKIAGSTVIERNDWAGKYIPLVRCVGEESFTDGICDRRGHVRALLDAQRTYNVNISAGMEATGLQTKVPYLMTAAQLEGHKDQWDRLNTVNWPYLLYNDFDDLGNRELGRPERIEPAQYPGAYLQGAQIAQNDMQMATGQYEATFGQESNERSGKAIGERARNAATSTYHFVNNLAKSIRYTGKILIDLIPKIYDTPRVIKILAQDGTLQTIQIDPNAEQGHQAVAGLDEESFDPQQISAIFNPQIGYFDIQSDIGPAYGTKRQEAFSALSQVMQENPAMTPIVGDLWALMSDYPDADILAKRLRNMVPPQALGQGPNPEVQQAQMHIAQQHQVIDALSKENANLKNKAMIEEQQKDIDTYKAETDRMKAVGGIDPEAMKPIIRQMVSEALATSINPLIHAHALEAAVTQNAVNQIAQPPDGGQESI